MCTHFRFTLILIPLLGVLLNNAFATADDDIRVGTIAEGLRHPWGMVFLPDASLLVTERVGYLRHISIEGKISEPIAGVPAVAAQGQGGLMGIALHPDFEENRWLYLSFAAEGKGGLSTEVVRGRFDGRRLHDVTPMFRALPKTRGGRHFGGRLLFDRDGYLYISLGDRGNQDDAQDLQSHTGSLIRLTEHGEVPLDNPYVSERGVARGVYTHGNRNMQGMALHPTTGDVWTHEHGPQGGDEVNIMQAGTNYGWPVITYGRNYGIGTKIGEGTHKPGMAQPIHKWVPSIAPSGMTFYTGDKFPAWRGDLLVGSLKFGLLVRLSLQENVVVDEQRMLDGNYGRIRDVVQGPDGYVYLLTDERNGKLLRVMPGQTP